MISGFIITIGSVVLKYAFTAFSVATNLFYLGTLLTGIIMFTVGCMMFFIMNKLLFGKK
jgi:hypothetical protein